jgi:small subunit ribosomal protein S9
VKGAGTEHIAIAREESTSSAAPTPLASARPVARVWVKPRQGQDRHQRQGPDDAYFARPVLRLMINQPLEAAKREREFDVICTVVGSGLTGQAGAVRHGIARALVTSSRRCAPAMRRWLPDPRQPRG